jgi:uncharacterized membrane protein YqiK
MGFLVFGIIIGLALIGGGAYLSNIAGYILMGLGAIVTMVSILLALYMKLYRKTLADEAFVRTGKGDARVVVDGGAFVIPIFHKLLPVSLTTMRLDVARRGEDALITGDNLRVDIKAEFFIKVQPNESAILAAARSLGEKSVSADNIAALVMEKLISALRTVAATKSLIELHTKRDEFAAAVQQIVTNDLQENGLTLESVTISSLDQTPLTYLKDDNVFDAQGKRRITEVTQDQLVRRNEIERNAERAIREKDVSTRKEILNLDRDREVAEATQKREVANVQAEQARETEEFAIRQSQEVELASVRKEENVQRADILKQQELAIAMAKREEAERVAQIARDKAQQEADVAREQAVEVARRLAEVAVANEETNRANAQAQTRSAEAAREEQTQRILTVQITADADRNAQQKMITEKQQVDIKKYEEQTEADVKAYTVAKVADGELQAAEKQKEAQLILAEADSESNKRRAEGQRAKEMVPVQVDREKVDVEAARVEVRRQDLENQEKFSRAALDFEIKKVQIVANKEVQIQMANAVGDMLQHADMRLFGDPTTVATMAQSFLKSVGWGLTADGFMDTAPAPVADAGRALLSAGPDIVQRLADRLGGSGKRGDAQRAAIQQVVEEVLREYTGGTAEANAPEQPEAEGSSAGASEEA